MRRPGRRSGRRLLRGGRPPEGGCRASSWRPRRASCTPARRAPGGAPHRSFILPGFFLFRIVDILKPFPVSAAERLPGGVGIMADDLVGGAMVNLFLQALNSCFLRSGWLYGLVVELGR
ncbi:phosphatidylglycerophosphatase A family protein [Fretibacterium fastidiosum]|uniref:phosphatidylglycerophosphatase A family protein n=1 Tax=Fretibacterium fastidiosum TaxID=651822 RepID=UPI00030A3DF4